MSQITNEKIKDSLLDQQTLMCPECGATTYGLNKSFCTRCDWLCDHVYEEVKINDEVNGTERFERCRNCGKDK